MKFLLSVIKKLFKAAYAWHKKTFFSDKCIIMLVGLIVLFTFLSILRKETVVKKLGVVAYCLLVIIALSKFVKLINTEK